MAEKVEELTVNYEEDGVQVVKELDKEILSKGVNSSCKCTSKSLVKNFSGCLVV